MRACCATVLMLCSLGQGISRASTLEERLKALEEQNQRLQKELADQRQTIDALKTRLGEGPAPGSDPSGEDRGGIDFGRVHLSGEGGVGFFNTSNEGRYSNGDFRVDEAKLFLEAPLWEGTYLFGELDLVLRESNDEYFHLGELYVDFENVLRYWSEHNYLSLRAGRLDIPFGEEYLVRDAIDNPLISHSLTDFWGVDEGVELYGNALGFDYVLAVQNGGHPTLRDFDGDKSVAGRLGYSFGRRARVSFSGMRTGELDVEGDELSEMWIGNGFFRSIGPAATTSSFEATLFQIDTQFFWDSGHLKLAGGAYEFSDNDTASDNERDGFFYSAEAMQDIRGNIYAAARFSQILAGEGLPVVGHGGFGRYFFGPLTEDLWRLSIGLGYRWNDNLITKLEYAREEGELRNGLDRSLNFLAAEIAFKF